MDYTFLTLVDALESAVSYLIDQGAEFDKSEALGPYEFGGIPYPQPGADSLPCVVSNFPLVSLKGKGTKKYGHIQVWRHESGRYEPNAYIL